MTEIVLGVAGGIAAYKSVELLRRLREGGHDVTVVPTEAALHFVGRETWQALSGRPVHTDVWSASESVAHVRLGQQADLVVVAPATADLLARAATGRADDLLTNVLLTAACPVLMAPAMHTEMWQHPATAANVATLRSRGVAVLDPASGRLTGSDSGPGRLPEAEEIAAQAELLLADPELANRIAARDLAGTTVAISAGGTREAIDPVRHLGNASSGRMGIALARSAASRGATVHLVAATVDPPPSAGVEITRVVSTADLQREMTRLADTADILVMAAAVADFTLATPADHKLKKSGDGGLTLDLVQTPDILAGLAAGRRPGQTVVGFAAETATGTDLLDLGRAKLARKGCDLLVVNDVSAGAVFGSDDTTVHLLGDSREETFTGSKSAAAHLIWDVIGRFRAEH